MTPRLALAPLALPLPLTAADLACAGAPILHDEAGDTGVAPGPAAGPMVLTCLLSL